MKRFLIAAAAGTAVLLGGCATTVRSNVTTFQQWPAALVDKTYVFDAPAPQEDTLEFRAYQNLVCGELNALGFHDAGADGTPTLGVSMHFMTTDIPVRVVEVGPPPFYGSYGWGHPHHFGMWGGWYDPFWYSSYYDHVEHQYKRELQVGIRSLGENRRLFDVTVRNLSRTESTPAIMPALVHSAFAGFPGPNGQARTVEVAQGETK